MKEKILKIFGNMKKLLFFVALFPWVIAAQSTDIYGTWVSYENKEVLFMRENNTFLRKSDNEVSKGMFDLTETHINVTKVDDKYSLAYILKGTTLYVYKPRQKQIWIFEKIGN